jgi:hypothetical protein
MCISSNRSYGSFRNAFLDKGINQLPTSLTRLKNCTSISSSKVFSNLPFTSLDFLSSSTYPKLKVSARCSIGRLLARIFPSTSLKPLFHVLFPQRTLSCTFPLQFWHSDVRLIFNITINNVTRLVIQPLWLSRGTGIANFIKIVLSS